MFFVSSMYRFTRDLNDGGFGGFRVENMIGNIKLEKVTPDQKKAEKPVPQLQDDAEGDTRMRAGWKRNEKQERKVGKLQT